MSNRKIVVTGSNGFIARNLLVRLRFLENVSIHLISRDRSQIEMASLLKDADVVFHLAGVNRADASDQFIKGNVDLTRFIIETLESNRRPFTLVHSSSTQAEADNDYGKSKLAAENEIQQKIKNGRAVIYRLPGIFGKWCRPNYNSVVATFCHNIANDLPVTIRDDSFEVTLLYVDDVVDEWIEVLSSETTAGCSFKDIPKATRISLGSLAAKIRSFKQIREDLILPDLSDRFTKALYSTYLSYLPSDKFSYPLQLKTDDRGGLFELLKSNQAGQIFISTTLPDVTRGNHFHHTKTEKFVVISGKGLIQFRKIDAGDVNTGDIIEYEVSGEVPTVVDIPPGYTHNIKNIGRDVMITLFWANELFDLKRPDTYFVKV